MTKQEQRDAWLYIAAGVLVALVAIAAVYPVYATDRPGIPSTPRTGENIPSTTVDALSASSSSATANPTLTANSGGGASNANLYESTDSLGLAFGNEAPIPYGATPECYVPGNGLKRAQGWVFGLVQLSAVLERDETCISDVQEARAHIERMAQMRHAERMAELEVERLQAENDAARGRVEASCAQDVCATK